MPPTTKPQTKKKEAEGKEKKVVTAVAAALLLLLLVAVFVEAQTNGTRPGGNQTGGPRSADDVLGDFKGIGKAVILGVRTAIALAFWVALAIVVVHFALGKVAPTRFQRLGSFWDGLERAKDIIYGYAWLFLLLFAIFTAIRVISDGQFTVQTFGEVVKWIMVDPLNEFYNNYLKK